MSNLSGIFDDIIEESSTIIPPVAILKELAQELTKKTQGLVIAEVQPDERDYNHPHHFGFQFTIVAPSLNNYHYDVLSIWHDLKLYPLRIYLFDDNTNIEVSNQESFEEELKHIFSSSNTRKVINGLLAQVKQIKEEDIPF